MNNRFQDITQFLKSGLSFQDLYHLKRTSTFGKTLLPERAAQRVQNLNKRRKELRGDILLRNRGIKDINVSGASTTNDKMTEHQIKMEERLERLKQWKATRDKKKIELKVQQKPLFKVCHVPFTVGLPNLETINTTIKGKAIDSEKTKSRVVKLFKTKPENGSSANISKLENRSLLKSKVTPSVQIKPSNKGATKTKEEYSVKSAPETKLIQKRIAEKKERPSIKPTVTSHRYNTRASTLIDRKQAGPINREKLVAPSKNQPSKSHPIVSETAKIKPEKTPEKNDVPCVYISPFVTISRGKTSARKEYQKRHSGKRMMLNLGPFI